MKNGSDQGAHAVCPHRRVTGFPGGRRRPIIGRGSSRVGAPEILAQRKTAAGQVSGRCRSRAHPDYVDVDVRWIRRLADTTNLDNGKSGSAALFYRLSAFGRGSRWSA
jgi:hypothetical protein